MKNFLYFIWDWIETKYKIWRFHRKYGCYHAPKLTIEKYENFYVSIEDKEIVDDINKPSTTIRLNRRYGFPFKTKK